jgi:hypothetical protein
MSAQVNQTENMSNSDKIKQQISKLSDIKIKYINFVFQLANIKNPLLTEHICQLIKLLTNAINIRKNTVLEELNECFTSLMLSYIFDINDLICDCLDIKKYTDKHQNLIRINNQIEHQITNYDSYCLNELKKTLLNV